MGYEFQKFDILCGGGIFLLKTHSTSCFEEILEAAPQKAGVVPPPSSQPTYRLKGDILDITGEVWMYP